ncbi:MAG: hypothetical protein V1874_17680 [Spirochaetota bacterium]
MHRLIKVYITLLILIFSILPVFAEEDKGVAKLSYGDHRWIAIHGLIQAQAYSMNEYDSEAGESESDAKWASGFQVRRSRFILNGEAAKNVEFFIQTDDILIGKNGSGSQNSSDKTSSGTTETTNHTHTTKDSKGVYTQDAFINYKFSNAFEVAAGLICLPFMHHNLESAASLLGVDYNSLVIPAGTTSNEWRDTGVEIRGIAKRVFDYRIGVFRGQARDLKGTPEKTDDINPDNWPRFCGRIQLNFADPETGFFYSGNYLGKKNVLSIGGGIDFQKDASIIDGELGNYLALTGDATIDYKVSDELVITLQGGYVRMKYRPDANTVTQYGYFGQMGFLFMGQVQPVIKYQYWKGDTYFADDKESSSMTFGLNYFIDGHNANIKAEYQNPMGKDNKAASGEKKATLQGQIFI